MDENGTCHYEPTVPSDEIWYTTTDGNIIEPDIQFIKDADGNKLNIVSNIYKNGKGVIKFNKAIDVLDGNYQYDDGEGAFHMKMTLSTIVLPDTIKIINAAFLHCFELKSINIPKKCNTIGDYAFFNTGLSTIFVPSSVEHIGSPFAGGYRSYGDGMTIAALDSINISSANNVYYSKGNCAVEKTTCKLIAAANNPSVPKEVEEYENFSLACVRGISNFIIGNNVKSIGENVFIYSDITNLTINQTEPPLLSKQDAFSMDIEGTPQPITIHVPSESVDKYKTADGWKDYADKIQAISE